MPENKTIDNIIDPQLFDFVDSGAMDIDFDFSVAPEVAAMEAGQPTHGLYQFPIGSNASVSDFAFNSAPTHDLHADKSSQDSESVNQQSIRAATFFTEQELAAQKVYLNNYGFSHTTDMTNLASHVSRDFEQRQRERLLDGGLDDQNPLQPLALACQSNINGNDLVPGTERISIHNKYCSPTSTVDSLSVQNLGVEYASKAYGTVQSFQDGLNQPVTPTAQQLRNLPSDTVYQAHTMSNSTGLDALIIRAQKSTQPAQSTPPAASGNLATKYEPCSKMPKAKKKSQPTPMQCAPLSISTEPNEKRLNIDISADGTPRVILREGEDPNQPISLAECVARPRDEQLTRPRDGDEPIQRLRINSRRSRPPYLPLEPGMTEEELLQRAMRNQEISELDRLDRRTRNNESARRTRERTKKTIADQAETIEQQNTQIQALQSQVAEQQQEIFRLHANLDQQRGGK